MAEYPQSGLVYFSVNEEGQLYLVLAPELYEALREGEKQRGVERDEKGWVRVNLSRFSHLNVKAIILTPGPDDPPCD